MSSTDRIPDEILQKILDDAIFVQEGPHDRLEEPARVDEYDRRAIRSVSRRLATAVDSTERYWLHVDLGMRTKPSYAAFCIERSGTKLISVDVNTSDSTWNAHGVGVWRLARRTFDQMVEVLVDVVMPVFHRVCSLDVHCTSQEEWVELAQAVGSWNAQSLARMTTDVSGFYAGLPWAARAPGAFTSAHRLISLVQFSTRTVGGTGLYTHLRRLRITGMIALYSVPWSDLKAALSSAQQLQHLDLQHVECFQYDDGSSLTLPNLTHLRLRQHTNHQLTVPSMIIAPALGTLCLELCSNATLAHFTRVCEHLLPSLTDLELKVEHEESPEDVIAMLTATLRLQRLDVSDGGAPGFVLPSILRALAAPRPFLPVLSRLMFAQEVTEDELRAILASLAKRSSTAEACLASVIGHDYVESKLNGMEIDSTVLGPPFAVRIDRWYLRI